jgi:hypothetical protein
MLSVGELNNLNGINCQVGQQGFQALCEGIAASQALYSAEISERKGRLASMLARALTTPRSPLFGLSVGAGSWSDDGFLLSAPDRTWKDALVEYRNSASGTVPQGL